MLEIEKEGWRKLQQDLDPIYERQLELFEPEPSEEYLKKIGISESEKIEAISQATKGLPYYLNWIRREKEAGREVDISRGNEEIVKLLLQGLSTSQKEVVQLAACCRWFNRSLIEYLIESQNLNFQISVGEKGEKDEKDEKLNCFDWLKQLDFVESAQNYHRLDDVARDVFRRSFWQDYEEKFRQIHALLASYFEQKATNEVPTSSSPPDQYENPEWRKYTAEYLYHGLFAKRSDCEQKFFSHLFTSCYLDETEVVTIPFEAITAEAYLKDYSLLPYAARKFLTTIKPIFDYNCLVFDEERLINLVNKFFKPVLDEQLDKANNPDGWLNELIKQYELDELLDTNVDKIQLILQVSVQMFLDQVRTETKAPLEFCFRRLDSLDGLAKFAALFYKSKHCPKSQQVDYLKRAQSQAERIATDTDPEFSSGLFLWSVGNELFNLSCYEEAIASYDQAVEFKPDNHQAWHNRGIALANLGRYEEAIASYDQAVEFKPDDHQAWYNRGIALANLGLTVRSN